MLTPLESRIQVFDASQQYSVVHRRLPHWTQSGTISFITWRTWDSMPSHVLQRWFTDRDALLKRHGIDPTSDWRTQVNRLPKASIFDLRSQLSNRWNDDLDACHGDCVLKRPELAQIIDQSLRHFDGDRYDLTDFVVMPNHVHMLAAFADEDSMLKQCDSWKHYSATRINQAICRKGRFWQQDGFDHLVRTLEQFEYLRRYIRHNPTRAKLNPGEYIHWSKPM